MFPNLAMSALAQRLSGDRTIWSRRLRGGGRCPCWGASLRALEPEVMTAGDPGRLVVTVLGMVADMELKFSKSSVEG